MFNKNDKFSQFATRVRLSLYSEWEHEGSSAVRYSYFHTIRCVIHQLRQSGVPAVRAQSAKRSQTHKQNGR